MRADHASSTALLIARSLVLVACDPHRRGLALPTSIATSLACLGACGADPARWRRACSRPWFRRMLAWLERLTLPGITTHYALRKRCIAAAVDAAVEVGARQLVVLAAGFDGLARHFAAVHPGLACFEIDHPATQAIKARALRSLGMGSVRLLPADLAQRPLATVLDAGSGFDRGRPAVLVAEGFLMYLDEERVAALLRELAALAAPGSRLVITAMAQRPDGAIGFPAAHAWVERWLRRQGEPFRWGIAPPRLAAFLAAAGFALERLVDHAELGRRYLGAEARPGAAGELVAVARRLGGTEPGGREPSDAR
jgi:methyltransferase (TIGR00027 family)